MEAKNELKIFQSIDAYMGVIGFYPNYQQSHFCKLSSGQIIGISIFSTNVVLTGLNLIFVDTDSFEEYIKSIVYFTIFAGVTSTYISYIFQNDQIFNIFERGRNEANLSKWSFFKEKKIFHAIDI